MCACVVYVCVHIVYVRITYALSEYVCVLTLAMCICSMSHDESVSGVAGVMCGVCAYFPFIT